MRWRWCSWTRRAITPNPSRCASRFGLTPFLPAPLQSRTNPYHVSRPRPSTLQQANPLITYTPMTPTHSRPSSRATSTTAAFDIDPFEEPSVPVASAIPLPLSPSSSVVTDNKRTDSPGLVKPVSRPSAGVQPFVATPKGHAPLSPALSTPNLAAASSQAQPQSPFSTIRRSRHQPTGSQASISSASILSPTAGTATGTADAKSPVVRATSPSGMSDTLSLVSATPSRTWTDGGTAEIFSGMLLRRDNRDPLLIRCQHRR